jgi:ABC-type amino acid transport substrate-binding protein
MPARQGGFMLKRFPALLITAAVLAAALGALQAVSGPAMAAEKRRELVIATEGAYPPFNYVDAAGELAGFDVDIARALCRAMDADCTLVSVKWTRILDGLGTDYDAVVASMGRTRKRDQVADFSDAYYRSRTTFIAPKGADLDTSPRGMAGKTVATGAGTIQADYLEENYPDTEVLTPETLEQAFDHLVAGRADAVLTDSLTGFEFMKTDQGRGFDFTGKALPADHASSSAHIAVDQGERELVEDFNQALKTIRLNGTYDRINRKYFPFSIY